MSTIITSAQSGYASLGTTQIGGIAPNIGDIAQIKPSHSVVQDYNIDGLGDGTTAIVIGGGGSTAIGQTAILTQLAGTNITLNGMLSWVTYDTRNVNATFIQESGITLTFLGTSGPTMQQFGGQGKWIINGTNYSSGISRIIGNTGRVTIGYINNGNHNSINQNYTYFTGFDSTATLMNSVMGRYFDNNIIVKNCRFKDTANWMFGANNFIGSATLDMQNIDFINQIYRTGDGTYRSGVYIGTSFTDLPITGTRNIKNIVCNSKLKIDSRDLTLENILVPDGRLVTVGTNLKLIDGLMYKTTQDGEGITANNSPGVTQENSIFGASEIIDNWHGVTGVNVVNGLDMVFNKMYFESINTTGGPNIVYTGGNCNLIVKNSIFNGNGTIMGTGGTNAGYETRLESSTVNLNNQWSNNYGFAFLAETSAPFSNWVAKNNIFIDIWATNDTAAITPSMSLAAPFNGLIRYVDYNASYRNPAKPVNGKTYMEVQTYSPQVTAVRQEVTIFSGSGLNNATIAGNYANGTTTATYDIKISSIGAIDQQQQRKNGGTQSTGINCTTTYTVFDPVSNYGTTGPRVKFAAITGHTIDDMQSTTFTVLQRGIDTGYLAHSISNINPQFVDNTRSLAKFADYIFGETGNTSTTAVAKFLTHNGQDGTNNVVHNDNYTVSKALEQIREGFTPLNMILATAGENGTYIGAVPLKLYYGAACMMGM